MSAAVIEADERCVRTAIQLWDGRLVEAPHAMFLQTVAHALDTDCERGLSDDEAHRRLCLVGPNELTPAPPVAAWRRLLAQFASPLVLLLIAATAISFVVWAIERETAIPYEAASCATCLPTAGCG